MTTSDLCKYLRLFLLHHAVTGPSEFPLVSSHRRACIVDLSDSCGLIENLAMVVINNPQSLG